MWRGENECESQRGQEAKPRAGAGSMLGVERRYSGSRDVGPGQRTRRWRCPRPIADPLDLLDPPLQVSDQEQGTTYSSQLSQLRICSRSLGFFHFLK